MPKDLTLPFDLEQMKHIIEHYPTPFHIYDEKAIRANARRFLKAFSWAPEFKEYFAVKATPNPYLLKILQEEGLGVDCSSMAELVLADKCGFRRRHHAHLQRNTRRRVRQSHGIGRNFKFGRHYPYRLFREKSLFAQNRFFPLQPRQSPQRQRYHRQSDRG